MKGQYVPWSGSRGSFCRRNVSKLLKDLLIFFLQVRFMLKLIFKTLSNRLTSNIFNK